MMITNILLLQQNNAIKSFYQLVVCLQLIYKFLNEPSRLGFFFESC